MTARVSTRQTHTFVRERKDAFAHYITNRRAQVGLATFRYPGMAYAKSPSVALSSPTIGAPQPAWHGIDAMQADAFRALLQGVAITCGLTHLAFCALFFWADVSALAYVSVASMLSFACVFQLARRERVAEAWTVTVLSVLAHAVLAVAVIGWDTGFHYYILLMIPAAVISSIRPVVLKAGTVLGLMLTYLSLDIALRHRAPANVLSDFVVEGLHYFNVIGIMVMLISFAGYYYYLLEKTAAALREMSQTDALTQLKNRRAITEAICREESRMRRGQHPLSFVLCDLDHFKAVNESAGHEAGNTVLKAVSRTLESCMRDVDFVARWGGEEFLAVLPDTNEDGARLVAERIRRKIEEQLIEANGANGAKPIRITMTLGVATIAPGEDAEQAIVRADEALYEGKAGGRNRVVSAAAA